MMARAVLYARFSPRPNALECESTKRQFQELQAWCDARNIPVVGRASDDAVSGNDRSRPGLYEAISMCQRGDLLLVREWDRFARDRLFAGIIIDDLRKKGVQVRSITEQGDMPETSESRLLNNILLDIAEYKREIIAARTKSAMIRRQKRGASVGGTPPYGYKRGLWVMIDGKMCRRLDRCPAEQRAIARIRELKGTMSCNSICKILDEEGHPCRGKSWQQGIVYRLMKRNEELLP